MAGARGSQGQVGPAAALGELRDLSGRRFGGRVGGHLWPQHPFASLWAGGSVQKEVRAQREARKGDFR